MQSVKARLLGLRVQNRNLAFRNQNNFIYEEGKGVFNVFYIKGAFICFCNFCRNFKGE